MIGKAAKSRDISGTRELRQGASQDVSQSRAPTQNPPSLEMISQRLVRMFSTSARRASHEPGGIPGVNLPFDINNPYKFTLIFGLWMGSAMGIPFLVVKHQMTK